MKPLLLDMGCHAGGASVGYARAGFDPRGVDLDRQPNYPFQMLHADALELSDAYLDQFDAIHASPDCQGYTSMRHAPGAIGKPRLIPRFRVVLERWAARAPAGVVRPWIIENVAQAREDMPGAITLCGSMFGLGAEGCGLQRHRLFISNIAISAPGPCRHDSSRPTVGIFGGHARIRSAKHGGRTTRDAWPEGHAPVAKAAMGMDWATLSEMSQAIPPAYTEWLGRQLLDHLSSAQRTAA